MPDTDLTIPQNDTTEQMQLARKFLGNNQFAHADAISRAVLKQDPENQDFLYILAVSMRLQESHSQSLQILDDMLVARPGYGRAHQERGYNLLALNKSAKARVAFELAVDLDPSLVGSWKSLATLYKRSGDHKQYSASQDQLAFLAKMPAELLSVISYMSDGKLQDAERLCRYFLRSNKTHIEGMRILAEIATRNKVLDDAEFLLESCVEFEPDHLDARIQYGNVLLRIQKFEKARQQSEFLIAKYPEDMGAIRLLHANACAGVGDNVPAIASYRQLIRHHPRDPQYCMELAHVLKAEGRFQEAVAYYQKAYELRPGYGDAYFSLANTKRYEFSADELDQMLGYVSAHEGGEVDRIQMHFALGKAFEDAKEYETSFEHYGKGNHLKQKSSQHHADRLQQRIDAQIASCTQELFKAKKDVGFKDPAPIFIVGLPRSGSTLVEQILSSHSQVDGTMELHNILNLAKRLRGKSGNPDEAPRYPGILQEIDASYFRRFGEQFINNTQAYRSDAAFFTDKMPNNFFHIGLIKLVLPDAKIIDARRHPMACCFSGFKQLFGEGQDFSYGLTEIGNYYRQYIKLMDHWDKVLPGFVLRVYYEDVVGNLVQQVGRLLDFCDLPFEQACIDFHKTERNVRTPSSEQVRQPIYTSGLELWRNYEKYLDPLKQALGQDVMARYPIE